MSGPPAKPRRKGQYWWLVLCFFLPFVMVGTYSAMRTAVKHSHPVKAPSFKEVLESQDSEPSLQSSQSSQKGQPSLILEESKPPKLTKSEIEEDVKEKNVFVHDGTIGGVVGLLLGIAGIFVSLELKKRAAAKKL